MEEETRMNNEEIKLYIDRSVKEEINITLGKWTRRNAFFMATTLVAMALAWGQLTVTVQHHEQQLGVGERFTATDGKVLQTQIDSIKARQTALEAWLIRVETKLDVALQK